MPRQVMFAAILFSAIFIATTSAMKPSCVNPRGIDDPTFARSVSSSKLSLPSELLVNSLVKNFIPLLAPLETPIQFRAIMHIISPVYSFAAAFHPTALEIFGRRSLSRRRRRCQPTSPAEERRFQTHRKVSLAYTILFTGDVIPGIRGLVCEDLQLWGLSCDVCKDPRDCLSTDTPWGLGYNVARDVLVTFAKSDGWNADGSLSRLNNKIPFQDWRGEQAYSPTNPPWDLKDMTRWQPLLESDGKGFLSYQGHVASHIGDSALSFFLRNDEICKLNAPDPKYNLVKESVLTLRRSTKLNDVSKSEVVLFDGKPTSLIPLQIQYFQRAGLSTDSWEFIFSDAYIITAIYEATIVVWRQKVGHDKVRPMSFIQERFRGRKVRAYAGPGQGTKKMRAEDWEPYIRTMPHAEYPSASACVCKAFENAVRNITNSDDVTDVLGSPLVIPVKAGSSPIESGVPGTDLSLQYSKWSDVTRACSQSRLNAGLHYTAAVSAGEKLCESIPQKIADSFDALQAGRRPSYVVRAKGTRSPSKKRCKA